MRLLLCVLLPLFCNPASAPTGACQDPPCCRPCPPECCRECPPECRVRCPEECRVCPPACRID